MPLRQRSVSDLHTGAFPKRPLRSSSLPQHQQASGSSSYSIAEETSSTAPLNDLSPFYMERSPKPRRSTWLRNLAFTLVAVVIIVLLWPKPASDQGVYWITGARNETLKVARPDAAAVPCRGPDGRPVEGDSSFTLDEAILPECKLSILLRDLIPWDSG